MLDGCGDFNIVVGGSRTCVCLDGYPEGNCFPLFIISGSFNACEKCLLVYYNVML